MALIDDRRWLARVLDRTGAVVGAAFAVDHEHLVTCAHVVSDAGAAGPGDVVAIEFPILRHRSDAKVLADGWRPAAGSAGDIAVLRLQQPPSGLRPASLLAPRSLTGRPFAAYGFPEFYDDGVWAEGEIRREAGLQWLQLEVRSALAVAPGFSGTAVWDAERAVVVGLMVTRDLGTAGRVAFAIPVRVLADEVAVVREALPTALDLDSAAESHWAASARGLRDGADGSVFTGRRHALAELVTWMTSDASPALRVVTGSPGSGKSAVLARLVTLSDRRQRQRVAGLQAEDATVPPVGCVDATFFAKDRTVAEFVEHLAAVCRLDPVEEQALPSVLRDSGKRLLVVVDALDEAVEPGAFGLLLGELASHGCRVLVACRPHLADRLADPRPLDLDAPPYLEAGDIEEYVRDRFANAPLNDQDRALPAEVAAVAKGNFLVAQLLVEGILLTGEVSLPFPHTVAGAFRQLVDALPEPETARELLLPLAYALGEGLPDDLWLAGAEALGRPYQPGDLRRLLAGAAGSFIVTAPDAGGIRRHRLFHQALAETLAGESEPRADQRGLWDAWTQRFTTADSHTEWRTASPYLLQHGATHAAAAGVLPALANDPGYLTNGDLVRLHIELSRDPSDDDRVADVSAVLRLTAARAQPLDAHERASFMALGALHLDRQTFAARLVATAAPGWRPRWAHYLGDPHQSLLTHGETVQAVATGTAGGHDVIVAGAGDGIIYLWDAISGEPLREIFTGSKFDARTVAIARVGDRDIIASAGFGDTVRLWDAGSGAALGEPLTGHRGVVNAVAIGRAGGQDVIASAGADGTVRLWDATSHTPRGDPLTGHDAGRFTSVALGRAADRDIVVSGDSNGRIRRWDAVSHEPIGRPFEHDAEVIAVAIGRAGKRKIIASSGTDRSVRFWDAMSGEPLGEPLTGPADGGRANGLATGRAGGRDIIASAGWDGTVRLWDPVAHAQVGAPFTGHSIGITSVAVGRAGAREIIVSGGLDGTVRVWSPSVRRPTEAAVGSPGEFRAVAIGAADGRELAAFVTSTSIQLCDAATGEVLHPAFGWQFRSVAAGRIGVRDLIVCGDYHNVVSVWDAATRTLLATMGQRPDRGQSPVDAIAVGGAGGRDIIIATRRYRDRPALRGRSGVVFWDVATGEALGAVRLRQHVVNDVAIGRVGERDVVVAGCDDGLVAVWNGDTREHFAEFHDGHHTVNAVAIGSVGERDLIAAATNDGAVLVWDAADGALVGTPLHGHEGSVVSVAIGRAGGRDVVCSAAEDRSVRVWDARTLLLVHVIPLLETPKSVALSRSGLLVVAGGIAPCAFDL